VSVLPLHDTRTSRGSPILAALADWHSRLTPATRDTYESALRVLAAWLKYRPTDWALALSDLATDRSRARALADRWVDALERSGRAPATVRTYAHAVRSALAWLADADVIPWSPFRVHVPPLVRVVDRRGPPPAAVRLLLTSIAAAPDATAPRDLALFTLLALCALRSGEARTLHAAAWTPTAGTVDLSGKGRRRATAHLPPPARVALQVWAEHLGALNGHATYLLPPLHPYRDTPMSADAVRGALAARCARAGLARMRPHGLRHTACTLALDLGLEPVAVARFARHSDVRITLAHYDDRRDDGSVATALAQALCAPKLDL